jgi:hypothetical protein
MINVDLSIRTRGVQIGGAVVARRYTYRYTQYARRREQLDRGGISPGRSKAN